MAERLFRRVLVANRGEVAARILRALRELGVASVAVHSEADASSPHLRLADRTVCIGPSRSSESYLDMDAILQAACQEECQALHPGFGFLAENALFASLCGQHGVTFIGPSPRAIRLMGDKSLAKATMREAGLPVIPGSVGLVNSVDEAREVADRIGYPILLKATAGGGGKGMRAVESAQECKEAFFAASNEAEKAFGCGGLYVEKLIRGGRHIEFQILVDGYGNAVHLGERECSIQRNHQKLIEEAPSPVLTPEERDRTGRLVAGAATRLGYKNAGTIEFLRDPGGELYFMEMNTRLQVEHPVTEMVTGVDIVKEQVRIAAGQRLSIRQEDVRFAGHAIECRINAEDPARGFRPDPGTIVRFSAPGGGPDVRLDTHVEEGYTIPPFYDSMIGKLIVRGASREAAIATMKVALDALVVEGVATTVPLHRAILREATFLSGSYDTRFLETSGVLAGLERREPQGPARR
jgi:acetyl-CoA carboxylase biotin carboxylase subunit